jgi:hypothetical protein
LALRAGGAAAKDNGAEGFELVETRATPVEPRGGGCFRPARRLVFTPFVPARADLIFFFVLLLRTVFAGRAEAFGFAECVIVNIPPKRVYSYYIIKKESSDETFSL